MFRFIIAQNRPVCLCILTIGHWCTNGHSCVFIDIQYIFLTSILPSDLTSGYLLLTGSAAAGEAIHLWSPLIQVQPGPHCLDFRYKLRHADLMVSVINSTDSKPVLAVTDDGQALVWHRAWADVEGTGLGRAGLDFHVTAKPGVGDSVGLDDVRLVAGECKNHGMLLSVITVNNNAGTKHCSCQNNEEHPEIIESRILK